MRLLLLSRVPILLPWSSRTTEFLASANSFLFSSWGRSCEIAIIIPKKVETIASSPRPRRRISRRSFLIRPGLGLRGRRELIRRGSRGGGGLPAPPTSAVPGCGIRVGTRSRRACTRSRLSAMRSPPTRRRLWIPPCEGVPDRRAATGDAALLRLLRRAPTRSRRPPPRRPSRSRRARSSSRSRMGLGRREARRRASLAKLRASPGVGGPAGPSSRSRSGERLPGSKSSSPRLSQSSSSASGDRGWGRSGDEPLPLPFLRPFAREPLPRQPFARPLPRRALALVVFEIGQLPAVAVPWGVLVLRLAVLGPRRRSAPVYVEVEIEVVCHVA